MRYWVYINDKVVGPYDEEKLGELDGFAPETLICTETVEPGGSQEWVKASSVFDFGDAARAATREALTSQDSAAGEQFQAGEGANSLTAQLLAKIDQLTQEINGMKGKLDEAVAASHAAQEAATQQFQAVSAMQQQTLVNQPIAEEISLAEEPLNNDPQVDNSSAVADVAEQSEIQIDDSKDNSEEKVGGEEVVLRSALDSLYNSNLKEQTEEEKEDTFQDLLSPFKTAATAAVAGAAVTAAAASLKDDKEKSTEQKGEAEQQPVSQASELTEEQREELINEITTPAAQEDFISKAITEAEQQAGAVQDEQSEVPNLEENTEANAPALEESAETETAGEEAPADVAELTEETASEETVAVSEEKPEEEPILDVPQLDEGMEIPAEETAADKEPIDLADQPQLNIQQTDEEESAATTPDENAFEEVAPVDPSGSVLTPMSPEEEKAAQDENGEEKSQTARELIPGKELEEDDSLISQKDLEEAFAERETIAAQDGLDFPVNQTQSLPEGEGFYNPKEMTEVQLKEGSTYLISDFIPPAEAGKKEVPEESSFAQDPLYKEPEDESEDGVEEIVPHQTDVASSSEETKAIEEVTTSSVLLENTIKTKRGATMDIKTVPMVQEPADSERLDFSDADLDFSAQHDMKAADANVGSNRLTKVIFIGLTSFILLATLYVMLAYLGFMPARYNMFKPAATAENTRLEDELLDTTVPQPTASDEQTVQPAEPVAVANTQDNVLNEVKNYTLLNGQTLEQLINTRHPAAQNLIEWSISDAVEPDNYSILVKVPPENAQGFKISYRFNYNMVTKALDPTISDSKNLLDSVSSR